MRAEPHRLVFVDETSVKTNMTRLRGRAPIRQRLRMDAPFGRWRTQTFVAGLTSDALISPWEIESAMDGPAFTTWIETQLVPELNPGTVFVGHSSHRIESFSSSPLDTLSTHKVPAAADALRRSGCWFRSREKPSTGRLSDPSNLPAYSPGLNPIEMAFAKLKAHLRRIGARTFDNLITALGSICDLFKAEECQNYLRLQAMRLRKGPML